MNSSNVTHEALIRAKPGLAYPYVIILGVCSLLGTLGNILVVVAILHCKKLRTTGNILILNLAIADFFVTCLVDPLTIVDAVVGEDFYDDKRGLCQFLASVVVVAGVCSLLSLIMISFNRYIHICCFGIYDRLFTRWSSPVMAIGLWVASFLVDLRYIAGWGGKGHRYDRKLETCFYDRRSNSYTLLGLCIVSVGLIAFFYIRIFLFVRRSKKSIENQGGAVWRGKVESRDSLQLAKMLLVVFVTFFICWFPYTIVAVVDRDEVFPQEIYILSILLTYASSSINWLIYSLMNRQFRSAYKQILRLHSFKFLTSRAYDSGSGTNGSAVNGYSGEDTS